MESSVNTLQFTVNSRNVITKDNFEMIISGFAKIHGKARESSIIHAFKEYSASKSLFDILPIIKDCEKVETLRQQLNKFIVGSELEELKILTVVLKNNEPLINPDLETLQIQKKSKFGKLFRRG